MTGTQLHTMLLDNGAALHLDAQGRLTVTPATVATRYKTAIQEHLCYLLVCAAIAEAQRLLHKIDVTLIQIRPMVSTQMLDAACLGGDLATCRQAAVTYVQAWAAWVQGEGGNGRH
jgi:hypothetical protein